jgi:hypothetical protein
MEGENKSPTAKIVERVEHPARSLAVATKLGFKIYSCDTGTCCYEVGPAVQLLRCSRPISLKGAWRQPPSL